MESPAQLPDMLCRLEGAIAQQGLDPGDFVDPVRLAAPTAWSEATVRVLLTGGCPPADSVNDRDISRQLGVSESFFTDADLRARGSLTRDQLERVLEGVLRSVPPTEGDSHR